MQQPTTRGGRLQRRFDPRIVILQKLTVGEIQHHALRLDYGFGIHQIGGACLLQLLLKLCTVPQPLRIRRRVILREPIEVDIELVQK